MTRLARSSLGATLIETMIAAAIFSIASVAVVIVWRMAQLSYVQGAAAAQLQGDVRLVLDQMSHDIRKAGRNLRNITSWQPIPTGAITIDGTHLTINTDTNDDGTPSGADEVITYVLNTATNVLTRNGTILSRNVVAPGGNLFTYTHTQDGTSVNCTGVEQTTNVPTDQQRTCTSRISITIATQSTVLGGPLTRTLRTDVDLRSR